MKNLMILSLSAVAAMALMMFAAGSASATALYSGSTKLGVGAELDWSIKVVARIAQTAAEGGEALDTCSTSTFKGNITNAGGASATVSGNISELTWGSCTFPTTTTIKGGLEVHQIGTSTEGTVTSNAEIGVTINTVFFGSCVYGVAKATDLGTLKTAASGTAEFIAKAVTNKLSGSNFACPPTVTLEAVWTTTTPDNLRVEPS
jgi:hypothetical protein